MNLKNILASTLISTSALVSQVNAHDTGPPIGVDIEENFEIESYSLEYLEGYNAGHTVGFQEGLESSCQRYQQTIYAHQRNENIQLFTILAGATILVTKKLTRKRVNRPRNFDYEI